MNPALQRQASRWYDLIDHPEQLRLIDEAVRFKVVPAGRRSGKTERAKRYIAKKAMLHPNEMYFCAAPTQDQAKKIWWDDMKALTFSASHPKQPRVSPQPIIFMPNGTEIHIVGLDKPARFEGIPWSGGVIDEVADIKSEAVEANIMPALDTVSPLRPDYRAWCWFIGVPDGLNHYYDMYQMACSGADPEWAAYHWKSAEILPAEVIDAAKRRMSAKQFKQEYEASFETATGRIYEDYGQANRCSETIQPHEQLCWMHDQNFTPLSSAIGVVRQERDENGQPKGPQCLYLLDEIVLNSAISRQSAIEFVEKYRDHENKTVLIYGDPAGRAGEKHGHASDYTEIEDVLRKSGWNYKRKVAKAHPAIKDRQNAVRAKICSADGVRSLFVNPATARMCDKGLATVQVKEGSTFQEDQTNEAQHITTAIGYMCDREWPVKRVIHTTRSLGY